jgi:hypothetical protein
VTISVASASSTLRAVMARALAQALVTGIYNAEQEGHPLTQLQQIDLATMTVMAYGETLPEGERALAVERLLTTMAASRRERRDP